MLRFPFYKQKDQNDCGPTCLKMLAKHYGRDYSIQSLRVMCGINRGGVNMLGLAEAAEKLGLHATGYRISIDQLYKADLPCILHWRQNHYVILYKIKKGRFYIADPAVGLVSLPEQDFTRNWFSHQQLIDGISLLLSVTPLFYKLESEDPKLNWSLILKYLAPYRRLLVQLVLCFIITSILSLIAPLLTQTLVDTGITTANLNLVVLILIGQIMLTLGSTTVSFIRSWIILYVSSRVNMSILADFLAKLMRLPISYFVTKTTGDIMQRINDQQKIESFLTGNALNAIFSVLNIAIFTVTLVYYNPLIFMISMMGTAINTGLVILFLKQRRDLNYKQFSSSSNNQTSIVELVTGIQEIKLNNNEQQKRWKLEHQQASLFKLKIKNLALSQFQQGGSVFINQIKNIVITFLSVKAVVGGQLTLGGMMAIQYLVGQLNSPIDQLIGFFQSFQDAKISLERLNEVHDLQDEEPGDREWVSSLPVDKSITINNLTFRYPGAGNDPVLKNIDLAIPEGKVTAIVGMSGSGKTTIVKLLLRFFQPENGEIRVGNQRIENISFKSWRSECGIVMQDGVIFSDTLKANICLGDETPDEQRLEYAIEVANIRSFVEDLPFGILTKIGAAGVGVSQGQKQRIFIARAVYKDPHYLFFDEATNALDSKNETVIMGNLKRFFSGRTVVVVAHRLSTVKDADKIIVLDKGKIIEEGTHEELTRLRGEYFQLISNQLEMAI